MPIPKDLKEKLRRINKKHKLRRDRLQAYRSKEKARRLSTTELRGFRDLLWVEWCSLPRRDSFSGLYISGELNEVQQKLDQRERIPSTRYYTNTNIEVG